MEKYINAQGKIGVLVSSGFGAGWSTWGSDEEYLCMDKTLVEMKLADAQEAEVQAHIEKLKGEAPYMGGWRDIEV